jgi:hypothetical protein
LPDRVSRRKDFLHLSDRRKQDTIRISKVSNS